MFNRVNLAGQTTAATKKREGIPAQFQFEGELSPAATAEPCRRRRTTTQHRKNSHRRTLLQGHVMQGSAKPREKITRTHGLDVHVPGPLHSSEDADWLSLSFSLALCLSSGLVPLLRCRFFARLCEKSPSQSGTITA